jgi:ATP-dependent DNA ligase
MSKKKFDINRYKTRPGQQRGNPEMWAKMGQALLGKSAVEEVTDLKLLNLESLPDAGTLKKAYRKAMMTSHPDRGGDHDLAAKVTVAYYRLQATLPIPKVVTATAATVDLASCSSDIPDNFETGYVGEIKKDGSRYALYLGLDPYGKGHISTLLSKHESKIEKGRFVDKTMHLSHITTLELAGLKGTVLDGEVFLKSHTLTQSILSSAPAEAALRQAEHGQLIFFALDVLHHRGQDVRHLPYVQRRALLEKIVLEVGHPACQVIPKREKNLQAFFDEEVAAGGEGIVLKSLTGAYGEGWYKLKKSYDVSVIVTGFKPGKKGFAGMVGSLTLSVYKDGKLIEVGFASGFDVAFRQELTKNFEAYRGRVLDVFVQELTSGGRFRHATYHRFRDDVKAETCTLEKVILDLKKDVKSMRVKQSTTPP